MPISPYLAGLHVRVGHQLITLPGVSACIFDEVGRILLARHVDSCTWALPGGAVEPDEDPAAAVAREVREELGIEVALQDVIGVYGGPEFRITYRNGRPGPLRHDRLCVQGDRDPRSARHPRSGRGPLHGRSQRSTLRPMATFVHADAVRWWHERSAHPQPCP
jgi:8-oxo-dGTP pyrophosphatase MutT (NUDIX family)